MRTIPRWTLMAVLALLLSSESAPAQQFSAWTAPVNLGATVNTIYGETDPTISKDGLSLYFFCADCQNEQGVVQAGIYVSQRMAVDQDWGQPQYLAVINQYGPVSGPTFSPDGHKMYFTAPGLSGIPGDTDIYVSRRHNKRDDFAWRTAENVAGVNSPWEEGWAIPFEDETTGLFSLYFVSNRPDLGGPGDSDLYVSTLQPDETFGPPVLVAELSSPGRDRHPAIRRDGLEIFFMSNRAGSTPNAKGLPSFDIWTSTRATTSDSWTAPVLANAVNGPTHDGHPSLSFDGTTLYFFSARPGNLSGLFDLWVATREKVKGDE